MILSGFAWLIRFTVLGLLVTVLIGPVVAVVGMVMPFALVGGGFWLVLRGLRRLVARLRGVPPAELAAWRRVAPAAVDVAGQAARRVVGHCQEAVPALRAGAEQVGRGACRVLRRGFDCCQEAVPVVGSQVRRAVRVGASRAQAAGRLAFEGLCGSIVGGLAAGFCVAAEPEYVFAGAFAGLILGLMAGAPRRAPVPEN
jgi:hypothetical protein